MNFPRIIATQGGGRYLVAVSDRFGRIADLGVGTIYPAKLIGSIVKWGYWDAMDDDPALCGRLMKRPEKRLWPSSTDPSPGALPDSSKG